MVVRLHLMISQRQEEQKQQISRLIELIKKRDMIERRIMKSVHRLEIQYSLHLKEFETAMSNKTDDLRG